MPLQWAESAPPAHDAPGIFGNGPVEGYGSEPVHPSSKMLPGFSPGGNAIAN